jgi:hypothetical protein
VPWCTGKTEDSQETIMIITKQALARRTFLRGLGVAIALPMLDAMVPALTAQAESAARPVKRLGFYYVPNGFQMANFLPKGNSLEISPILSSMEPFRNQMVVVSGLANSQADHNAEEQTGAHTRAHMTWLSGIRPKRTEGADIRGGITLDQHAANALGKETPLQSLELALEPNFVVGNCEGGYSCTYVNTFSWRTPTTPLPMETNPRVVFERLFGEAGSASARVAQMRKDRSVLDAVARDMAKLQRTLGPADRTTVVEYVDSVRDVERRLQQHERHAETAPEPDFVRPSGIPASFEEHARLMFDLQFLAYRSDITRVSTFQIARELSTRSYPEIGVAEAHHDVSHHNNNPEKIAQHTKINTYHLRLFSRLVEKMRATQDGDGSLLDHAILVYGAGMGDGSVHSHHNLPVLLVGGGCGELKGGRLLRQPTDTPMMNLGLSLLDKVGVSFERLGDSTGRVSDL